MIRKIIKLVKKFGSLLLIIILLGIAKTIVNHAKKILLLTEKNKFELTD